VRPTAHSAKRRAAVGMGIPMGIPIGVGIYGMCMGTVLNSHGFCGNFVGIFE